MRKNFLKYEPKVKRFAYGTDYGMGFYNTLKDTVKWPVEARKGKQVKTVPWKLHIGIFILTEM